jgi:hypothetical protein
MRATALFCLLFVLALPAHAQTPIFADGFESGDLCWWSIPPAGECSAAVVFVSRTIPDNGSIYWNVPKDMPGVGTHSRFRVAAPGRLQVREADGTIRTLVDGSAPGAASLFLIDVNAPDVSYDGEEIVFAGLRQGSYGLGPNNNPGAWRIYAIRPDGGGLRQVTFSDQNLDLSQFGGAASGLAAYDDTDPAFLPDGRIVFSSTRWPSYAQYSGARASNLYVVDSSGANLHRITAERNGADRPLVDPLTGKIVYSRWWRNHRFATDDLSTVTHPQGGFRQKDGLTIDRNDHVGGSDNLWRNFWQIASIAPDGTGLEMWGGFERSESDSHVYGGAMTPDGDLIANFFPMYNMTEAAGFGGLRRFSRGAGLYRPIIGITTVGTNYVNPQNPTSYGILVGNYAGEPTVLPGGKMIFSWAEGIGQDYALYLSNLDGSGRQLLHDQPGRSELRARLLRPRPLPPILPDTVTGVPSLLPPTAAGPYNLDGTFAFDARNVYANGPVDMDIVDAPPIGSAASIHFFLDHQRNAAGSFPNLDWPIALGEAPVAPDGSVFELAPAHVPLFEQLRDGEGKVPLTGRSGAAHVAGMNFGRAGSSAPCVGCHAGHTMIPLPATVAEAKFSNLAPGAAVTVSSTRDANQNRGLIDRRVLKGEIWRYWNSDPAQPADGQWLRLVFPVPVTVREVRLYNPRQGGEANSSLQVHAATVRLFADAGASQQAGQASAQNIAVVGTPVAFADVLTRVVEVRIDDISGTFYGMQLASLAEVEVIARGESP